MAIPPAIHNNPLAAGASSQRPTHDAHGTNGLGIVAALLVFGGFATLYGRRGHRSHRLRTSH